MEQHSVVQGIETYTPSKRAMPARNHSTQNATSSSQSTEQHAQFTEWHSAVQGMETCTPSNRAAHLACSLTTTRDLSPPSAPNPWIPCQK
eukprot:2676784-Rhodomonas_salina.2